MKSISTISILTSTLPPETSTTFESQTEDTTQFDLSTIELPIITTTSKVDLTTSLNTPILTTTSDFPLTFSMPPVTTTTSLLETSTISLSTPVITSSFFTTLFPYINLTTISEEMTSPPILTTSSPLSTIPEETTSPPILTTFPSSPLSTTISHEKTSIFPSTNLIPNPTFITTREMDSSAYPLTTSSSIFTTKSPLTLPSTSSMSPSSTITSTFYPTSTPLIETTSQISGTTCPQYPDICPLPDNPNNNFGDNNLDPRLVLRPKRQFIGGCPCIDIRSALKLLIQNGMLQKINSNVKNEIVKDVEEFEGMENRPPPEKIKITPLEVIRIIIPNTQRPKHRIDFNL